MTFEEWWDRHGRAAYEAGGRDPQSLAAMSWDAALAREAEPVAWIEHHKGYNNLVWEQSRMPCDPLYAHPPAAQDDAAQPSGMAMMMARGPTIEVALARQFHETYERLAPQFGYTTREDTRQFDPESANGKLMIAVCATVARERAALSILAAAMPFVSVDHQGDAGIEQLTAWAFAVRDAIRALPAQDDAALERAALVIPTSWLDPMLTGPKAVIGSPPYGYQDVERLLGSIAAAIRALKSAPPAQRAHSMSEYKRLTAQGADVLPPAQGADK